MDAESLNKQYRTIFLALLLVSASACAHFALPADVRSFVEARDVCDHLRGEIPDPDPENMEGLDLAIDEANQACAGTDIALKGLKIRYKANAGIIRVLARYEDRIEASAGH